MINQIPNKEDKWIRVPVSALQKVSDHLCNIDCIQARLLSGSIKDEVGNAHRALIEALGNNSHLVYAKEETEAHHA